MKRIVVDTNVLIRRPQLFFEEEFAGCEIIIPTYVLGEVDKHKKKDGEIGYGARLFSRTLSGLLELGTLKDGVTLDNGTVVKTFVPSLTQAFAIRLLAGFSTYVDDLLVSMMRLYFKGDHMLTGDLNLQQKVSSVGVNVEFSMKSTLNLLSDLYKGRVRLENIDKVEKKRIEQGDTSALLSFFTEQEGREPFPNEFVTILNSEFVGRFSPKKGAFVVIKSNNAFGFSPKNKEQKMLFEAVLNPNIKLVTLTGSAGTGKTFGALACALQLVMEEEQYKQILIGKNTAPLDKNSYQGFTTGSTEEKLLTHFGNYLTNLENLFDTNDFEKDGTKVRASSGMNLYNTLNKQGTLEILDISSILGSSFKNKFIIIDEAQSFDMNAMRSILTRVGEGTKIIVIGDILQSTIANLSGNQSGLFNAVDWLKEVDEVAHINLKTVERSTLVSKIAKIFDERLYG